LLSEVISHPLQETKTIMKSTSNLSMIDAHHHFMDPSKNRFQSFLKSLNVSTYLPLQYKKDVIDPILLTQNIKVEGTVHVECLPDDGFSEAKWVNSLIEKNDAPYIKAIVASCNLADPNIESELRTLVSNFGNVKGIRWILDCVGPYQDGKTATHVATSRFGLDGIDFLRGSNGKGTYNGKVIPEFEKGFALLEKFNLSFDLQCAPVQLIQASHLFSRYPNIRVCIDHLGKPRTVLGEDTPENKNFVPDENEISVWRNGMQSMASLPQVYVKLSMLGYAVPGWINSKEKEKVLKSLVREVVELFGVNRCMIATNWFLSGAVSDADGLSKVGPTSNEMVGRFLEWFHDYGEDDMKRLFSGTAKEFYFIE